MSKKLSICKRCGKYEDVCTCPKAQPQFAPARCCAVPSALELAIGKNLTECGRMRQSQDPTISAMGTHGESMMLEMQRLLPDHDTQHNTALCNTPAT